MRKIHRLLAVACLLCAAGAVVAGCSLTSVSGSEGSKNVDVTMGGHLTTDTTLDFKAVGYGGGRLQIENTASAHDLVVGAGTPITTSDGTVVAKVVGVTISIAPGQLGTLALDQSLMPGQEYFLGATPRARRASARCSCARATRQAAAGCPTPPRHCRASSSRGRHHRPAGGAAAAGDVTTWPVRPRPSG